MKIKYSLYTLENKMRVLLFPTDTTNAVTVHALLESGAALEDEKNQGLTHLVEHMALTCTESWPTKEILNTEIEYVGGTFNGSTGKEALDYYVTLPYTKIDFGVKVIYEVLYKALISEKNLKTEKTVIIDEISKYTDDVIHVNGDFIDEKIFEKANSYSYDIAGTKETVESFTIDQVKDHYKFSHSPQKVLLSVIGNFNEEQVRKLIDETFGTVKYEEEVLEYSNPKTFTKLTETRANKKTDLINIDLMFPYKGLRETKFRETLIGALIRNILAGPSTSRLKKRLREEEGLLYGINIGQWVNYEFGFSYINYEIEPRNFEKALAILKEELIKFLKEGATKKELDHYKEYLTNKWLLKYDDPKSYARLIKYPIFYRIPVKELDEMITELKSITKEEIDTYAKELIDLENANYFAFGNVKDETKDFMLKTRKLA